MKIAILNISNTNEIEYTLSCLESIHKEIIAVSIDLFIHKDNLHLVKDNKYISKVIPLDMNNLNIFNFKAKLDALKYYTRNKYNIAIDTQGTFKSAYLTYQLTGKTAGFKKNNIFSSLYSNFYDEKIQLNSILEKEEKTKVLLSKIFGF